MKALSPFPLKTLLMAGFLSFIVVKYPPFSMTVAIDKDTIKEAEFYPLSSYPMYSMFSEEPIYTYITDLKDKPLALSRQLGAQASQLTKDYTYELKKLRKAMPEKSRKDTADMPLPMKQQAAALALKNLKSSWAAKYFQEHPEQKVRLWEGVIRREGTEIKEQKTLVGEL